MISGVATPGSRLPEVDLLKSVGILTVVLIHSLREAWDPHVSPAETWLIQMTRFAVPAFFMASGYLYGQRDPIAAAVTRRRFVRLLAPYLAASLCAEAYRLCAGTGLSLVELLRDFALAAAFGSYYFVFVLAVFVASAPWLVRVSERHLTPLAAILVLLCLGLELVAVQLPASQLFWELRNPFFWAGYFAFGWWLRLHRERMLEVVTPRRSGWVLALGACWVALAVGVDLAGSSVAEQTIVWLGIMTTLTLLYAVSLGGRVLPAPLRWLSDATYAIYLFHLFFVLPLNAALPRASGRMEPAVVAVLWAAGILGPALLVVLARRLAGPRSRLWVGA